MPEILVNGVPLYYRDAGGGSETFVMSHCYLLDHRCFEAQIDALSAGGRVVAYDQPGHGRSGKPDADYSLYSLTRDAESFLEALGHTPVHWIGLSTGGFIGMRLALHRPDLLRSLVLIGTSAEPVARLGQAKYRVFFWALRTLGFRPLMPGIMMSLFGPEYRADAARSSERALWRTRVMANDAMTIIAFGKGIASRTNLWARLAEIRLPTLVVVGEQDQATPVSHAHRLTNGIRGARMLVIPGTGHVCTIERPDLVIRALRQFYAGMTA